MNKFQHRCRDWKLIADVI